MASSLLVARILKRKGFIKFQNVTYITFNVSSYIVWSIVIYILTISRSYGFEGLKLKSGNITRFVECGIPRNVVFDDSMLTTFFFNPSYHVIENNLRNEGNLYIRLENVSDTIFHFYGPKHPDYPNYKIYSRGERLIVEFCPQSKPCQILTQQCEQGVNKAGSENRTNNVAYLSWKKETDFTIVLVEMNNSLLKCFLADNHQLHLQKLVMSGTKKQTITTYQFVYNIYTENNKIDLTNTNFNLKNYVLVNIFQCLCCRVMFKLKCINFEDNTVIEGNKGLKTIFSNKMLHGWASVKLPTKKNKTFSELQNCSLEMEGLQVEEEYNTFFRGFWVLAENLPLYKEEESGTSSTTSATTPGTESTTIGNRNNKLVHLTNEPKSTAVKDHGIEFANTILLVAVLVVVLVSVITNCYVARIIKSIRPQTGGD